MKLIVLLPLSLVSTTGLANWNDAISGARQACFQNESSINLKFDVGVATHEVPAGKLTIVKITPSESRYYAPKINEYSTVKFNQNVLKLERGFCAEGNTLVITNLPITDIDARAFNAFNIWRDGLGEDVYRKPIYSYPIGYDRQADGLPASPEGTFFVSVQEYYSRYGGNNYFVGTPTNAAFVSGEILTDRTQGGVLEYRPKNGNRLIVKFSEASENVLNQTEAVEYCEQKGLRLPTARELFDFCAKDTAPSSDKHYFRHRCEETVWSASVWAENRDLAWAFYGALGVLSRKEKHSVRCVGIE
jgi:hypothetical protein